MTKTNEVICDHVNTEHCKSVRNYHGIMRDCVHCIPHDKNIWNCDQDESCNNVDVKCIEVKDELNDKN